MTVQEAVKTVSFGNKIGISEKHIGEISDLLHALLADVQALYIKTRGFHWNLEDPRFYFLHKFLNDQYEALEEDGDLLAERIRQIGRKAPGSLEAFKQKVTIKEVNRDLSGQEMIENLVNDYNYMICRFRKAITLTSSLEDHGTADICTQILREFEKTAWMLRSHLVV